MEVILSDNTVTVSVFEKEKFLLRNVQFFIYQ